MRSEFLPALRITLVTWVLCGLLYPLVTLGLGQALFPSRAAGSLLHDAHGQVIGSRLIGQAFSDPRYFWPRTSSIDYVAASSGASNLGPTNPVLIDRVASDSAAFRAANPAVGSASLPVDLLTTSGSGLDPDITPAAAFIQVPRVAAARHLSIDRIRALIVRHTTGRTWELFGEPRVNVLELNLALDALSHKVSGHRAMSRS